MRAAELSTPTLLLSPARAIASPSASQARVVFERLGAKDKTLRMLAGQYHEVLNEPKADP